MKRKIVTFLSICLIGIVSGCSNQNSNDEKDIAGNDSAKENVSMDTSKDNLSDEAELSGEEKAAVAACQYVREDLDDNSTFELRSAKVINDLNGDTKYYLVKLEYTEHTLNGESVDLDNFQTIDSAYENPWIILSELVPQDPYVLQGEDFYKRYLSEERYAEELDCKKIMDHIDDKVN